MTVKQLKDALTHVPDDVEVMCYNDEWGAFYPANDARERDVIWSAWCEGFTLSVGRAKAAGPVRRVFSITGWRG